MTPDSIYRGLNLRAWCDADGIAELCFDAADGPVNKFDQATRSELRDAVDALARCRDVIGLMLTSARDSFVVGADINEFGGLFRRTDEEYTADMMRTHRLFADIEDLPFPTAAVIEGPALGGGFEICLACDYRIAGKRARVGLPEIHLGIFPGWGGTIRLPRLIGFDPAIDWIASGRPRGGAEAMADGAVDALVEADRLRAAARDLLLHPPDDVDVRRRRKTGPLERDPARLAALVDGARLRFRDRLDPHYPALGIALDAIAGHGALAREQAMAVEIDAFIKVSRSRAAASLVGLFLAEQAVRKKAGRWAREAPATGCTGIVGGGAAADIAARTAAAGITVRRVDSQAPDWRAAAGTGDEVDMSSRRGLADGDADDRSRGGIGPDPWLEPLAGCDLVVEALDDDDAAIGILTRLVHRSGADAVIATSAAGITVDEFARRAGDGARLLGMHVFNADSERPLVEVVRGAHTAPESIGRAVGFALAIGAMPIVARDGPGAVVNRALVAFINAFELLLRDGVDFEHIDRVMREAGWTDGPAGLIDALGIETVVRRAAAMASAFPVRMDPGFTTATQSLYRAGRFGRRRGSGYYRYPPPMQGAAVREHDAAAVDIVYPGGRRARTAPAGDELVARMVVPPCIELARCLEEGIIDDPLAVDVAAVYGLGFPRYLGGALRYIDHLGAEAFCALAERCANLGGAYIPSDGLKRMAERGERFFG